MANVLSPVPKLQFFDNNGKPAVGYKVFTYEAGTSTKLVTYQNDGVTQNSNPIVLDYRGEANVWIPPNVSYKLVFARPDDTDPPGAPIWSVDNVSSQQLLTLFGGVDTGTANNYIVNYDSPYSSYEDGQVIYWIPANTNTGPSTMNVNGLGPIPILSPAGTALVGGEIVANQFATIGYLSGSFTLLSFNNIYLIGAFTGTIQGCDSIITATFNYTRTGSVVSLTCNAGLTGISNANFLQITGLPSELRPFYARNVVCIVRDNGANQIGWVNVANTATMEFSLVGGPTSFTTSGQKGIPGNWQIVYSV